MKTTRILGQMVIMMGFLTTLLFGGEASNKPNIPELIKNGAIVIDARSAKEFSTGHIEGAINIPHNVIARDISTHAPTKDQVIIIYCLSGGRSAVAKKSLEKSGYSHVINAGGLQEMRKLTGL
jgi:rhodanese-related sulfurtransferase